ncbi:MAG: hypothetical protein HYS13_06825 [Planctomycetia bacterium]|nr:hypothetical protein [Planctomycetia bacterium]
MQTVKVDYTEPDLRYDLAHGSGNDPYDGLDRFDRVIDLLWRDYGRVALASCQCSSGSADPMSVGITTNISTSGWTRASFAALIEVY